MKLRDYQNEAVANVMETWAEGVDKTLLILPTGTGKTIVFATIALKVLQQGGRLLILAHRAELLTQAQDKIEAVTGIRPELEKAESTCEDSWCNIVVGSVQSFNEKRLERFGSDYFTHIIIDEAHHTLASTYMHILEYFSGAKVLGVTATADRGDKRSLGEVYQSIAYEMSLFKAIQDGWLVRIQTMTLPVSITMNSPKRGDWSERECSDAIEPYLEDIARQVREVAYDRKIVFFLPLIATSQHFRDLLCEQGFEAREINGQSEDREETLEWFRNAGPGSALCNSMLLTEGWDEPSVNCVCVLRPTKVRALYVQMVGRGTRLSPGKTDVLLLDFLWHCERHQLIRPTHLVCKNPDLSQRISEIMAEKTGSRQMDLIEAEKQAESTAREEREEALRKELEKQRLKKRQLVDPLQFETSISDGQNIVEYVPDESDISAMGPPSQGQLKSLEKYGIYPDAVQSFGHARKILDVLSTRRFSGLTTPKQIRCLERFGFQKVGQWTFDQAKTMIDRIAANGWRCRFVNPKTYKPEVMTDAK